MKNSITALNSKVTHLYPLTPSVDWEQVLGDWLSTKRSIHTQRAYRKDIVNFLAETGMSLGQFLSLDRFKAFETINQYKGGMMNRNLGNATINRRLSAVKSLVKHCYQCGHADFTLETVKGEKLTPYRDTTGITLDQFKPMLNQCDRGSVQGLRDYAILLILWSNALRRNELIQTNISDFDPIDGTLRIYGKGRGNESEVISLGKSTVSAITAYLMARGTYAMNDPLFIAHKAGYKGVRLSSKSIYNLVRDYAQKAGINKVMSPHRIRHSAITTALDLSEGNVRSVQKLSRHKNLNTLLIYDDNRKNLQVEITNLLDSAII